ncbi:MAG TPA: hypothetical protein VH234_03680 [Candidatus Saccharimonadales bacterium]|jgi:hypothetical protein|nr:hypothetical protein [Candidatus Saccharimonadales bacterium]
MKSEANGVNRNRFSHYRDGLSSLTATGLCILAAGAGGTVWRGIAAYDARKASEAAQNAGNLYRAEELQSAYKQDGSELLLGVIGVIVGTAVVAVDYKRPEIPGPEDG